MTADELLLRIEIDQLRRLVRELYKLACAELGPAREDIAKDYKGVLERALDANAIVIRH